MSLIHGEDVNGIIIITASLRALFLLIRKEPKIISKNWHFPSSGLAPPSYLPVIKAPSACLVILSVTPPTTPFWF